MVCKVFCIVIGVLLSFSCLHHGNTLFVKLTTSLNGSLQLSCNGEHVQNNKWLYENTVLCFNRACLSEKYGRNIQLLGNYSLFLDPVLLSDEGVYTCYHDGSVVAEHHVKVTGWSFINFYSHIVPLLLLNVMYAEIQCLRPKEYIVKG